MEAAALNPLPESVVVRSRLVLQVGYPRGVVGCDCRRVEEPVAQGPLLLPVARAPSPDRAPCITSTTVRHTAAECLAASAGRTRPDAQQDVVTVQRQRLGLSVARASAWLEPDAGRRNDEASVGAQVLEDAPRRAE